MATTEPSALVERLRATALDLVSLVTGADSARLGAEPAPGEWSAATVLAHLADVEMVYGVRLRMVLTAERPWLASILESEWADRLAPLEPTPKDSLQRWRLLRDANLRVLASLADGEWARQGVHQEQGAVTVADLARTWVEHDQAHLGQIRLALAAAP